MSGTEPTSADEDDMDHAELEELLYAAQRQWCCYDDGSGDDGNPAFALIQINGGWTAVCAYHAQAAAEGELKTWIQLAIDANRISIPEPEDPQ